jgi:enamine deaminase RidA (YjgF/YER057c/UK114 family)
MTGQECLDIMIDKSGNGLIIGCERPCRSRYSRPRPPHGVAAGTHKAALSMSSNTRFMNPPTIAKPGGYSHVVEITGPGRIVYIAGQLGLKPSGDIAGDFRAQVVQAFENLKSALAAVGAGFDDVVKLNNYLVDIKTNLPIYREVRDKYVNTAQPPASTTVGVTALARPDALFEAEAIVMVAK